MRTRIRLAAAFCALAVALVLPGTALAGAPSDAGRSVAFAVSHASVSGGLGTAASAIEADPIQVPLAMDANEYAVDGITWVDGRVFDNFSVPVGLVEIVVTYRNALGDVVGSQTEYADCWIIAPGSHASFSFPLRPPAGVTDSYAYAAAGTLLPADVLPTRLAVTYTRAADLDGKRSFTGKVTNNTSLDVSGTIVGGLELENDPSGPVLDALFSYESFQRHLAPGESFTFRTFGLATPAADTVLVSEMWAEAVGCDVHSGINIFESRLTISRGATVKIHGRVLRPDLSSEPHPPVIYQTSTDGHTWRGHHLPKTGADGRFTAVVRPDRITYYRFSTAVVGIGFVRATAKISPRVSISRPTAPARVARARTFTVTGTLRPKHSSASRSVTIRCYREESGAWVLRKTVRARLRSKGTASAYRASLSLPSNGLWRLVARAAGDSMHATTDSSARSVRVGSATL